MKREKFEKKSFFNTELDNAIMTCYGVSYVPGSKRKHGYVRLEISDGMNQVWLSFFVKEKKQLMKFIKDLQEVADKL